MNLGAPSEVRDLQGLIHIKHGFAFKGEHFSESGNYVLLTPANFFEQGGFRLSGNERYYSGRFPSEYVLDGDALIVAMTEQAEGLLGSTARIPVGGIYLHNQRLGLITVTKPAKLEWRYLYWVLNSQWSRAQIRASSNGAKVRHTSPGRIYSVEAFLPEKHVQQKIAAILTAYDDLIENNKRRIALLEKMAEEIYRAWFVRLRFPGHEFTPVQKGIPEGWTDEVLEQAFKFTGGGTPSKEENRYWVDGHINWFTPSDITAAPGLFLNSSGTQCTDEGLRDSSAKIFPAYSIMLTSRATIGAIGINTTPACTNQGFITCLPNKRYPLTFLFHWLKLAKPHFEMLSTGATFAELTKGTFKRLHILRPADELMASFDEQVSPMFELMEKLLAENELLTRTRELLLGRLISGKLRVDRLDIQFPPSMREST